MAYEFTRLADVTAIEEVKEEDSVLVVQDGEVKRAPKTAVGGAGGGTTIVITWDGDGYDDFHAPEGAYETIREMIQNRDFSFNIILFRSYEDYEFIGFMRQIYVNENNLNLNFDDLYLVWRDDGSISSAD